MTAKKTVYYYQTFQDDFVTSPHQAVQLPADFDYQRVRWGPKLRSWLLRPWLRLFSYGYQHLVLHLHVENRQVLRQAQQQGIYLYSNHTQTMGDAFLAFMVLGRRRPWIIASPANWGLPGLRRILAAGGAVPLPQGRQQFINFQKGLAVAIQQGKAVLIYPEAHVWPYYTKIRPLPIAAFHYPTTTPAPVFAMTVTYQQRHWRQKPKRTVYLDGPFSADQTLTRVEQQRQLRDQVAQAMVKRSQTNNYHYYHYQPASTEKED
ncbi:lysophospholipid acyltransferase family protein [Lapidilactobacillus gannanensis]|jgi:1-acyl-sn-glycerol-3-phosphate acyltransferase|uniref:Lysophospholipid acyltransferase family protein n=1 Tax=Lapidilactobacillus gannanensis TaxID=2486002 RepID=A0ABW4BKW3_9LACO|nr:1-acyl-sn-glycerol-3-phosphate acyltransferase [Lapidilactobacillus gannanensis]